MSRDPQSGVVLVNVLAIVALAAAALTVMLSLQETGLTRTRLYAEAARAGAIARGAEASAMTALRRDAAEAPGADHAAEPWGQITESGRAIEGGTLTLRISDAQDRFNINALVRGDALALSTFAALVAAAELPQPVGAALAAEVRATGPVSRLETLSLLGFSPTTLHALSPLVTALPAPAPVNLNSAGEPVLAVLLGNAAAAARLVAIRARKGFVDAQDLRAIGVLMPSGAGFASRHYRVVADVRIGEARRRLSSLLRRGAEGKGRVSVIERRWGPDADGP